MCWLHKICFHYNKKKVTIHNFFLPYFYMITFLSLKIKLKIDSKRLLSIICNLTRNTLWVAHFSHECELWNENFPPFPPALPEMVDITFHSKIIVLCSFKKGKWDPYLKQQTGKTVKAAYKGPSRQNPLFCPFSEMGPTFFKSLFPFRSFSDVIHILSHYISWL